MDGTRAFRSDPRLAQATGRICLGYDLGQRHHSVRKDFDTPEIIEHIEEEESHFRQIRLYNNTRLQEKGKD